MARNTKCLAEIVKMTIKIRFCYYRGEIGVINQVKKTRKLQKSCVHGERSD